MTPEQKKSTVGRPRKSETTVKRQINVYLPDMIMRERWKEAAKDKGLSISKFVIEHVEEALNESGHGNQVSRQQLMDEIHKLTKKTRELQMELDIKTKVYEVLDRELQSLREKTFQDADFIGSRQLNKDLIPLFKLKKQIDYDDLLPFLGIKPTEIDMVRNVNQEIKFLEEFGLIKSDLKGWTWQG